MKWSDEGMVLSSRKYSESALIVTLMTESHGRHSGLVRGGTNKRNRGVYEPGNILIVNWQARLEEHLGTFSCELRQSKAVEILNNPLKLAGLSSVCTVTECSLPEREPCPVFYKNLCKLIYSIDESKWVEKYVVWEMEILAELGFGLDLDTCVSTGDSEQLVYVSPKSGRAVSKNAGEPYHSKMLTLPPFLISSPSLLPSPDYSDILAGLELTGFFLKRHVFGHSRYNEPAARTRFVDRLKQSATISSI